MLRKVIIKKRHTHSHACASAGGNYEGDALRPLFTHAACSPRISRATGPQSLQPVVVTMMTSSLLPVTLLLLLLVSLQTTCNATTLL